MILGRVGAIALNTYRESVRARILLGLAGVAFAVAFYSIIVGAFTLRNAARVVTDLGAASTSLFAIAVAIVIGATSLHRELEQKTIFPILARPITRGEYLVGKYLGTLLTLAVFVAANTGLVLLIGAAIAGRNPLLVLGVGFAPALVLAAGSIRSASARTFGLIPFSAALLVAGLVLSSVVPDDRRLMLASSLLVLLEVAIVAAIATVFSSFSTPFLSSLLTIGFFLIGRNADALARLPAKTFGEAISRAGKALSTVAPNLQVYVPARPLLTGEAVDVDLGSYLLRAAALSLGWSVGFLALAILVFRKRDFL